VFFLRDPIKFPSFIRSQKRRADSNLRDHDMQWDFWTLSPESAHQVTWLMGDRGIPRSRRYMNLYSHYPVASSVGVTPSMWLTGWPGKRPRYERVTRKWRSDGS
jgi:hypothetical protein